MGGDPSGNDCLLFQHVGIDTLRQHFRPRNWHAIIVPYRVENWWRWKAGGAFSIMSRPGHRQVDMQERMARALRDIPGYQLYGQDQPGGFLRGLRKDQKLTWCSAYVSMVGANSGFGLSEHEAMSWGCPIVARRWGDMATRFYDYPGFAGSDEELVELAKRCSSDGDFARMLFNLCMDYIATYHTEERFEESIADFLSSFRFT